mgnify:CR=1 FL=1
MAFNGNLGEKLVVKLVYIKEGIFSLTKIKLFLRNNKNRRFLFYRLFFGFKHFCCKFNQVNPYKNFLFFNKIGEQLMMAI